jgi:hypothetical protein
MWQLRHNLLELPIGRPDAGRRLAETPGVEIRTKAPMHLKSCQIDGRLLCTGGSR